ncbi:MAG: hypothetical protein AAFN79_16790 [Pseudomonadota bacterium]
MTRLMKTSSLSALALAVVLGAVGVTAPQVSFAATEIGSVAAANRDIEGTPPGAATRSLLIGDRLIQNERLVSSPDGSGQMIFLDQTTLTVSPNSEIILDEYVYDPDADSGQLGLTVTRGVLRMVGGRITKSNAAVINTPSATIGIRGGIGLVAVAPNGDVQVMHVAGETTTVDANGETLTISRSNGFATVSQGEGPVYQGVADASVIAGFYSQMQGGGGGSDNDLENDDAEGSGIAAINSEDPDAVVDAPISTSGESAVDDDTGEVETLTIVSDPDVQLDIQDGESEGGEDLVFTEDFAAFIGGLITRDAEPFIDASGALINNPAAVNLSFTGGEEIATFASGSVIVTLEEGDTVTLPDPQDGFFAFGPDGTASPEGTLTGRGFGDSAAGLFLYDVETSLGNQGAIFGAEPGPTQLRTINANTNAFRTTPFDIKRDLAFGDLPNAQAFLPASLRGAFNGGTQAQLFLINPPNSDTFGAGSGSASNTGSKWLISQFMIQGEGAAQSYLLHVGATSVLNNGADAPDLSSFGRGSFRGGGVGFANRIQPLVGSTAVPESEDAVNGPTIYGRDDSYLLLGNSSAYHEDLDPESETSASFLSNIETGGQAFYGSLHLAEREADFLLNTGNRFAFGSTPAAFAAERGLTGATAFGAGEAVFNSYTFASTAFGFRAGTGATGKAVGRTLGVDSLGGAAFFSLTEPEGSMILNIDEIAGDPVPIDRIQLAFGGRRSAVIDGARFGLRDHNDLTQLANVLTDEPEVQFIEGSDAIRRTGRPPNSFGQAAFRGAALSHGLADSGTLFPADADATPEFLTWGYWTGQFRFDADANPDFDNARLQFALSSFVSGNRTDVVPTTGVASFDGAVILNVLEASGADYVDGGRFEMDWDFGVGNGTVFLNGLLGEGEVVMPVDQIGSVGSFNDYGGGVTTPGDTTFQIDGAFFDGPVANDARATAGSISTSNSVTGVISSGVYFGER